MGAGHGHSHAHAHGHDHAHGRPDHSRRLKVTLGLVLVYMVAEVVGGLLSGSLALLADAGHMLSDAGALMVSILAMKIARRPASATHTFGYQRAEILAALANGTTLVAVAAYVFYEAIQRLGSPPAVQGPVMLAVAAGGLAVNVAGLVILHGGRSENLNVRGAWLHVLSDALGSVGAITGGVLVTAFGWYWADPAASLLIATLVLYSAFSLLGETTRVLMQAVPARIDLDELEEALLAIDGVLEVHDLHVWSLTSGREVMSAHLGVTPESDRAQVMQQVQRRIRDDFALHHSTVQLDCPGDCAPCA